MIPLRGKVIRKIMVYYNYPGNPYSEFQRRLQWDCWFLQQAAVRQQQYFDSLAYAQELHTTGDRVIRGAYGCLSRCQASFDKSNVDRLTAVMIIKEFQSSSREFYKLESAIECWHANFGPDYQLTVLSDNLRKVHELIRRAEYALMIGLQNGSI